MVRAHVVVEGRTEESFVRDVLAPGLWPHKVILDAILVGPSGHKGGNTSYARLKRDVLNVLKQDERVFCTTMLDFYGLGKGYPGPPLPPDRPARERAASIERAMKDDIAAEVPHLRPDVRFLPYLQLHEYEALLFSDPEAFAAGVGQPHLGRRLAEIRADFETPEDINDDPNTAPSKRVLATLPSYRKVVDGTLAAQMVGIAKMRQACPHFREWLGQLEGLAETQS